MEWEELELNPGALPMGSQVGPWRVRGWAGRGTYGTVYRAVRMGQEGAPPVALKLAMYAQDERFGREVELLSRVCHPSVPRLVDHGVWRHRLVGAYPYLVMEWLEGGALYPWASERNPSSRQVLRVLAQVARALEATHAVSAVHRDVKGTNIRVRPSDGRVFLLDFGAGHYAGAAPLTRPPMVPGTPAYRSPEASSFLHRYAGEGTRYEAGPSDDVFALGVTAYRLVTDEYPPSTDYGDAVARRCWQEAGGPPEPRGLNPRVDAQLNALILRMLSVKPEARGSASELADALERAAEYARPEADGPLFEWETVPSSQWSEEEAFAVEMWGHRLRRREQKVVREFEERDRAHVEVRAPAVSAAARSSSTPSERVRRRERGLLAEASPHFEAYKSLILLDSRGRGPHT